MSRLYINPTLQRKMVEYCEANSISDLNAFANRCALQGFSILKYGDSPSDNLRRESEGINDYKIMKEKKNGKESIKKRDSVRCDEKERESDEREQVRRAEEVQEEGSKRDEVNEEEKPITRKIRIIKKS